VTIEMPKISIIVAVLNGARHADRCIASVAGQTYQNRELIVIDGGSKDGTVEILQKWKHEIAYWVSEPDHGISDAWNKGLARATGDWLCFLGADDYLTDLTVLAKAAEQLRAAPPRHLIAYGDVLLIDDDGELIERSGSPWDRDRFTRWGMTFSHQGGFYCRSLFSQLGSFDGSYQIAGDYEWLLRAVSRTEPLYLQGLTVASMQTGGLSSNDANGISVLREYARAQRRHLGRVVPWALGWTAAKAATKLALLKGLGKHRTRRLIDAYRGITGRPPRWKDRQRP
jgi:glycosyltransferase involved in cell wall biosynthesis